MIDPQYIESVKKGTTVMYGNKSYRVQDDRGYLHIIVFENGHRKKIAVKNIQLSFEYGSEQDYIFNGWHEIYTTYELFKQFADNDKIDLSHKHYG